jgi:opacity protein-like surface antigen
MKHLLALAMSAVLLASASVANAQSTSSVIVNRQPLSIEQVQVLEWYYGVDIGSGAYWYDPI